MVQAVDFASEYQQWLFFYTYIQKEIYYLLLAILHGSRIVHFCTTTLPCSNILEKKGLALEAPVLVEPTVFESRASTCPEFADVGGDGGCHLILIPRAMMLADSPVIGVLLIHSLPNNLAVEGMIGPGAG